MRTGMEPFFDFISAVVYAFQQTRIEYQNWQSYRRNMPRTSQHAIAPTLSANHQEAIL
jgi:hypothetical protein